MVVTGQSVRCLLEVKFFSSHHTRLEDNRCRFARYSTFGIVQICRNRVIDDIIEMLFSIHHNYLGHRAHP